MAEPAIHPHYRAALITGVVAAAGVGLVAFAAVAPVAAAAVGIAAGGTALYAGGHWARRKLGIGNAGRKWRQPKTRPPNAPGGPGTRRPPSGKGPGRALKLPSLGGRRQGSGGGPKLPKLPGTGGRKSAPGPAGKRPGLPGLGRGQTGAARTPGAPGRTGAGKSAGTGRSPGGTPGRMRSRLATPAGRKGGGKGGLKLPGLPKLPGSKSASGKGTGTPKAPGRRGGKAPSRSRQGRGLGLPSLSRAARRSPGKPGSPRKGALGKGAQPRAGVVHGVRRIQKGKRKGQWQRYHRTVPASRLGKAAVTVGETAAAPFFLSFLAGRWVWRRTRKNKTPAAPAPSAPNSQQQRTKGALDGPVPDPVPKTSRPSRTGRPLHDFKEGPTIMNHIDAAGEAVIQHIGSWEPSNASDLDMFLASLPRFFESTSQAFRTVADKLADGYPMHPAVPEILREIATTISGMSDFSGEAHATHRTQHEKELERLENPRSNEKFWDVQENQ